MFSIFDPKICNRNLLFTGLLVFKNNGNIPRSQPPKEAVVASSSKIDAHFGDKSNSTLKTTDPGTYIEKNQGVCCQSIIVFNFLRLTFLFSIAWNTEK